MSTVCVIGAGALGVRHLEGLLKTSIPLSITVVDPSTEALHRAKSSLQKSDVPAITFTKNIPVSEIDLAIVATTSGDRAEAIRRLLEKTPVKYLLLEKILFTNERDYADMGALLEEKKIVSWVNCPLRIMPLRRELPAKIQGAPFALHISGGSQHGLMTNSIHYADFACTLARRTDFTVGTSLLVPKLIPAKRPGYFEIFGTLTLTFPDGSRALFTSLESPATLRRTTLESQHIRAVLREPTGEASVAEKTNDWKWEQHRAPIVLQSEMTGPLVEQILATGTCDLPLFQESVNIHRTILKAVRVFLDKANLNSSLEYPFT